MVAEYEETMGRDRHLRIRPRICIRRRNVVLVQRLIVHVDLAAINADAVARHPDHALDVALGGIARIAEDHNIPTLDRFQPVYKLVDEDSFLVVERGHHAGSLNFHRLVEEDDDESRDRQRNDEIAHPDADPGSDTNRNYRCRLRTRDHRRRGRGDLANGTRVWGRPWHAVLLYTEPAPAALGCI